jgi:SRSO17 transposase
MLFIDQIPPQLQYFLGAAVAQATDPQRYWMIRMVLAMAVSMGKRNVKALTLLMAEDDARSTLNDFFTESPWSAPVALQSATLYALAQMKLQPGERIEVLLDGSQKAKRGEKMEALGWVKEAGSKEWRKGHRFLLCYLRVRGVLLPWAVDLYLSDKFLKSESGRALKERRPETHFRTLNEMAAELLASLPAGWETQYQVVVLMDSGFCNATACQAVRARGFNYVVAAQASRILVKRTGSGKKGKRCVLKTHAPGRLQYQGRDVRLPPKRSGGKGRLYRVAEDLGTLRGLGAVKVVYSRRKSDDSVLSLVSSDTGADAREIALAYGWRWEIEVVTKALKQRLGLGQYQFRYYEGMVHHLHLSLLAHLILTTAELQRRGSKAWTNSATLELPSVSILQTRLQQELWRSIAQRLRVSCTDQALVERIDRALGAA